MSVDKLGPLRHLVGTWEGDKGKDVAPSDDRHGADHREFRESFTFEETGLIDNHEQLLYGLRFHNNVWKIGSTNHLHMEDGFWMWDAAEKQIIKCFSIPRGVSVLAGGTVELDAKSIQVSAELGSATYGICSNPFLDKEFQTVKYDLKVDLIGDNSFKYFSDTTIKMKGKEELFHHTDQNTLFKTS